MNVCTKYKNKVDITRTGEKKQEVRNDDENMVMDDVSDVGRNVIECG